MLIADSPTSPRRSLSLPPELAVIILSQAPDARTLRNLILSAPCFYLCFPAASRLILHAVLFNEFGSALLPIVLAIHRCEILTLVDLRHVASQRERRINQEILQITRANILNSMVKSVRLPYGWTLSDSLALTELHDDVDWFASEYSATLLGPFPDEVKQICEPLRRREMDRVRSAFFRFELYRRLHLKCRLYEDYPDANDNKEVFPKMFAPWENEQLVTIYEYLLQRLSIG